jgi:hypothetical protein
LAYGDLFESKPFAVLILSIKLLLINPGSINMIFMLNSASSCLSDSVNPSKANLLA